MPNKEPSKAEVLRGTLDLMVLQTLDALGPQHGYAIGARLEQVSSGALTLNMGTLYPGLMCLEQQGLVKAEWGAGASRGEGETQKTFCPGAHRNGPNRTEAREVKIRKKPHGQERT
jgi:PadR family transcriptional regulator PadR